MSLINTDKSKCVRCKRCVEVCPLEVLALDDEGFPISKSVAFQRCINCGYCVDICALHALNHKVRKSSHSSKAAMKRYENLKKRREVRDNEK